MVSQKWIIAAALLMAVVAALWFDEKNRILVSGAQVLENDDRLLGVRIGMPVEEAALAVERHGLTRLNPEQSRIVIPLVRA